MLAQPKITMSLYQEDEESRNECRSCNVVVGGPNFFLSWPVDNVEKINQECISYILINVHIHRFHNICKLNHHTVHLKLSVMCANYNSVTQAGEWE